MTSLRSELADGCDKHARTFVTRMQAELCNSWEPWPVVASIGRLRVVPAGSCWHTKMLGETARLWLDGLIPYANFFSYAHFFGTLF
jgi:hypothetical protein